MSRLMKVTVLCMLLALLGCAARNAGPPRYKPVEELKQCEPDECVETELRFRHWANSVHYRGRMPYHCDPGSELDGRPDPNITRMIFVVHGVVGPTAEKLAHLDIAPGLFQLRNVNRALRRAQQSDPTLDPSTIAIIAPTFQRTHEWQPYTDEDPRVWSWNSASYPLGTLAEYREATSGIVKAESVSSYDVMDEFLRAAVVKFPNIEDVVIIGHSAGGQFVQRYVWMSIGVHEQLEASGIHIRYVPTNPGGYAFPIWQRKDQAGHWVTPKGCERWDEWGFGLAHLSKAGDRQVRAANYAIDHYLRPHDRAAARKALRNPGSAEWGLAARRALTLMYASREVWHIQAATDDERTFADSCRASWQGRTRYERFKNFQEIWATQLGIPAPNLHFVALENASHPHSSAVVYASDAGMHLLFH